MSGAAPADAVDDKPLIRPPALPDARRRFPLALLFAAAASALVFIRRSPC